MSVVYWLLTVFGIGFVIFFHELGHFMAARAMGVRVEAFSIGFGPRLLGFRWGVTDWKICLIPLGGFVKMAGETPNAPRTGAADEFSSKSVAARSLIISAGVIMNVILALIALPIAFMVGVPFEAPVIGAVEPGSPAWRAGLRASDRVISVDGRHTLGYEDVVTAIAIGGDVVKVEVERDGKPLPRPLDIPTRRDERRGLPTIGVEASYSPIEIKPEDVDSAKAASDQKDVAAHRQKAGLQAGDRLLAVDGVPVADPEVAADVTVLLPHTLRILRAGEEISVVLPPFVSGKIVDGPELFGFGPVETTVKAIVPGSPAAGAGLLPADRVLKVGDQAVFRRGDLVRSLAAATADSTMTVERAGRVESLPVKLSDPEMRRALRADVDYTVTGRVIVPLDGGAAGLAGFRRGDEVVAANGVAIAAYEDIQKIDPKVQTVKFSVRHEGESEPVDITVTRARVPDNEALLGLEHSFARETVRKGFADSFSAGFDYTVMMTARVFMTLKSLFSRRVSASNLGGIITIFRQSVDSSKIAISRGLLFMAVISINLAVLNVLPIPVLDGGWLLLLMIEKLRGRPVSERVLGIVSWIGLILILGLMAFVTWNDIKRL